MNLKPITKKRTWQAMCAFALLAPPAFADSYVLKYNRPADFFEEALPIGNGNLGALIYGRTGLERISLNDITLWTGEPEKTKGPKARHRK